MDRVLPMGLCSAALICQCVTNAVSFIYNNWGWFAVNYLHEFGGAEVWDKAQEAFDDLKKAIKASGLEESEVKACGPSTSMIFLGVLCDTIKLTLSVTELRELLKLGSLKFGQQKRMCKN